MVHGVEAITRSDRSVTIGNVDPTTSLTVKGFLLIVILLMFEQQCTFLLNECNNFVDLETSNFLAPHARSQRLNNSAGHNPSSDG